MNKLVTGLATVFVALVLMTAIMVVSRWARAEGTSYLAVAEPSNTALTDPIVIDAKQFGDRAFDWLFAVRDFDSVYCEDASKNAVIRLYRAERKIEIRCE